MNEDMYRDRQETMLAARVIRRNAVSMARQLTSDQKTRLAEIERRREEARQVVWSLDRDATEVLIGQ